MATFVNRASNLVDVLHHFVILEHRDFEFVGEAHHEASETTRAILLFGTEIRWQHVVLERVDDVVDLLCFLHVAGNQQERQLSRAVFLRIEQHVCAWVGTLPVIARPAPPVIWSTALNMSAFSASCQWSQQRS
jgi:hypothetical protein